MELALRLLFKNELTGPMKQAVQQVERDLKPLTDGAGRVGDAFDKATKKTTSGFGALDYGLGKTKSKVEEVATTVERQATRMERALARVNQGISAGAKGMQLWGQAAAGFEAGKYILSAPVGRAMGYDMMLAHASNVALAGESITARRAGKGFIDDAVKKAVKFGGGTREDALGAYGELVGSGVYDKDLAAAVLPSIVGAATANNGSALQFSAIALAGRRNMGLGDDSRMFDMATMAGQRGGFEIADMSRWLPQQMAAAKSAGLSGWTGYAQLLALNQAAGATAGTKDEAGNNVANFLSKVTSRDTALKFKQQKIDLDGEMLSAMEGGKSGVDAFGGLVDKLIAKDPRYAALKAKAHNATGDEQKAIYDAMAQIVEGAGIGKIIQDRQALMGFLAYRNQPQYQAMIPDFVGAKGVWKDNLQLVSEAQSFKSDQWGARKQFGETAAFGVYGELLGKATDMLINFADTYPRLTSAAQTAATALTTLAAVAGAVGLVGVLTGKLNPADLLKKPGQWAGAAKTAALGVAKNPARLGGLATGAGLLVGGGLLLDKANEYNAQQNLVEDYRMAQKGLRRKEGMFWQGDTFAPINNKSEQDALIARLAEEIAKLKISVQIDGREVARSVNAENTRDSRRQ